MAKASSSLGEVLREVAKRHDLRIGSMADVVDDVVGLTTGNLAIDYCTDAGGLPLGRITELYGSPSSGKAQPLDAQVLTPGGFVKMGDLQLHDAVIDPAGGTSEITGIFPQGVRPVYRLTFTDGTSTEATADHLWAVTAFVREQGYHPVVQTTVQLAKRTGAGERDQRVRLIPLAPVDFTPSTEPLPLDPYLLGVLLAAGRFINEVIVTIEHATLRTNVTQLLPVGCVLTVHDPRQARYAYRIVGMSPAVRELGLFGVHGQAVFVPERYKYQSAASRLALLQGLMDAHGTPLGEFHSPSRQLRDDVQWLARSLGLKATEGRIIRAYAINRDGVKVVSRPTYRARVYPTADRQIFRLVDKCRPLLPALHRHRKLQSVEYSRDADCQCIQVSAPSHQYVTDDFIPTHNTTTALQCAAILQQEVISAGRDEYILYLDFEHAMDGDYAASLGLDVNHPSFILVQPDWLEDGADISEKVIRTGKVRLAIWDSVAEMTPKSLEFGVRTNAMERARLMNSLLQRHNSILHENNCAGVFLNHMVEAISMGGPPGMPAQETSPGGKALKFYASLRLAYKQVKNIKGQAVDALSGEITAQAVGTLIKVRVTKNKIGTPWREATVRVGFGTGFDNLWSALQVLTAHKRIVPGATGHYYFDAAKVPELVHADMAVSSTGRPYIRGEGAVLDFAGAHADWATQMIKSAVEVVDSHRNDTISINPESLDDVFSTDLTEVDE